MPVLENPAQWTGHTMVDPQGEKIGTISEIYLDQETELPEWALVNTGMFGTKSQFVPLTDAEPEGDTLRVPYEKTQVKDAPGVEADGELTQEEEKTLYAHYGFEYGEDRSASGLPEGSADERTDHQGEPRVDGHDVSGPTTDNAMTRSEEELSVGTASREKGRVRLRKYIVTENVTTTVPVEREEVRVEREPITDGNVDAATTGGDLSEEEHEVVLHEEEVVTEKRVVPKERVRLDKETVTEQQQVTEEVRKEQIDSGAAEDIGRE